MKEKNTKFRFDYAIKFGLTFIAMNSIFNLTAIAQVVGTAKPLPSIYVPKEVSDVRKKWFIDHKYNIINNLAVKDGAQEEIQDVYLSDARSLSNMLDEFLQYDNMSGMRIYIGSRRTRKEEDGKEDKDSCGKIKLMMVPTKNKNDVTSLFKRKYYTYENNSWVKVQKSDAKKWVRKYQNNNQKRRALDSTLTAEDLSQRKFETKHVYFDIKKVIELRDEINDWVKQNPGAGLKIRLVSYNDADSVMGLYGIMIKQKYKQRLTVDFVFTDSERKEVYMSDSTLIARKKIALLKNIDSLLESKSLLREKFNLPNTVENWNIILKLFNSEKFRKIRDRLNQFYTMDTGAPAPPPYGIENMAALDFEP